MAIDFDRRYYRPTFAVLLLLQASCSGPEPAAPADRETGLQRTNLQGTNLQTWQKTGDNPWRFEQEAVEAGPAKQVGYLVSNEEFGSFRLSVEYWIEDDTNSGIFVRCTAPAEISPNTCYEINIWDNHPNQAFRTGSIVSLAEPLVHVDGLQRWVRVEIEADGASIRAFFDGKLTAELTDDRSLSGFIALQYGGEGLLKWRNLKIEPLPDNG